MRPRLVLLAFATALLPGCASPDPQAPAATGGHEDFSLAASLVRAEVRDGVATLELRLQNGNSEPKRIDYVNAHPPAGEAYVHFAPPPGRETIGAFATATLVLSSTDEPAVESWSRIVVWYTANPLTEATDQDNVTLEPGPGVPRRLG